MIDLAAGLGGIEAALRFMESRGWTAIEFAIYLAGGPAEVARELKVSPGGIHRMMQRTGATWKAAYLTRLAELSGVSLNELLASEGRSQHRSRRAK